MLARRILGWLLVALGAGLTLVAGVIEDIFGWSRISYDLYLRHRRLPLSGGEVIGIALLGLGLLVAGIWLMWPRHSPRPLR